MAAIAGERTYTVGELTRAIRGALESDFRDLWVEGEISNCRRPSSGHVYFTLKDSSAQIRCAMFKRSSQVVRFKVEDGMKVLANGSISVYEPRGEYQLVVKKLEPRGVGALQLAFEQLKQRLEREGLFREERKRPIPMIPDRIGIVTSPTGAAIRDILNVIGRRFAPVHLILYPVRVQGTGASSEIAEALRYFSRSGTVDVVIAGRGGGSIEDLWAFNEEEVARAIYESAVPVIAAIGHEIDFTIADFTADKRAPTPSAAAELVVAERERLAKDVQSLGDRVTACMEARLLRAGERVEAARGRYGFRLVEDRIKQWLQRMDELGERLGDTSTRRTERERGRVEVLEGKLAGLNPLAVLSRGYSLAFKLPGRVLVRDAADVGPGDLVEVKVARGEFRAKVEDKL